MDVDDYDESTNHHQRPPPPSYELISLYESINQLNQLCHRWNWSKPKFEKIRSIRIDLKKFYTIRLSIDSIQLRLEQSDISKRLAKLRLASDAMRYLQQHQQWPDHRISFDHHHGRDHQQTANYHGHNHRCCCCCGRRNQTGDQSIPDDNTKIDCFQSKFSNQH